MAILIIDDYSVVLDGNDISDHVKSGTLNTGVEMQDKTAMTANTRISKGGLKTWAAELELFQDYADGNIDSLIFPLQGTDVTLVVKPTSAAVGAGNPSYTGLVVVGDYAPLDGAVGDMAMTSLALVAAGDLVRSVTP